MLRNLPSPSVKVFNYAKTSAFQLQGLPSPSAEIPSPLSSPAVHRTSSRNLYSPLKTPRPFISGNNTVTQSYFPSLQLGSDAEPAKSCLKKSMKVNASTLPHLSLKIDLIPCTMPDSKTHPIDLKDRFSLEKIQLRSVKDRVDTPMPSRDDVEWLDLQNDAELMREAIIEEIEEETTPRPTPELPSASVMENIRPSLPAFKKFCSLASRRGCLNVAASSTFGLCDGVIYSTAPPSVLPLRSMLETSQPSPKPSFAAQCFIPGRPTHNVWISPRDRPSTPCPRCSVDVENMFESAI